MIYYLMRKLSKPSVYIEKNVKIFVKIFNLFIHTLTVFIDVKMAHTSKLAQHKSCTLQ